MTDSQKAVLFCLVHIIWSDNFQAPEEVDALRAEIEAQGLDVGVRDLLLVALGELPPTPEQLAAALPDEDLRRQALDGAIRVAFADGVLSEHERVALQDLARAFGMPEAELKERLAGAEGQPRSGDTLPPGVLEALRGVGATRRL